MKRYESLTIKFLFKALVSHHKTRRHIRLNLSVWDLEAVKALSFMSTFLYFRATDKTSLQWKVLFMGGLMFWLILCLYFDGQSCAIVVKYSVAQYFRTHKDT
jgi:hypothetical protein